MNSVLLLLILCALVAILVLLKEIVRLQKKNLSRGGFEFSVDLPTNKPKE